MLQLKNSTKIALALLISLVVACIFNVSTVNAAEYSDEGKTVIFTVDDLGINGKQYAESSWFTQTGDFVGNIDNKLYFTNIKQEELNKYASSKKETNITVKMQIPDEYIKAELDGENIEIIETNGKKYIEMTETLKYTNTPFETPLKNDIEHISFSNYDETTEQPSSQKLKLVTTGEEYEEYYINNTIILKTENEPFKYMSNIVNKYGQAYTAGGMGDGVLADKFYLQTEEDIDSNTEYIAMTYMPKTTNWSETYFQVGINVYQGNEIELENLGTLYYSGIMTYSYDETNEEYYIYKNSLDKLQEPKRGSMAILTAKTETGYTLQRAIHIIYHFDDTIKETDVNNIIGSIKQNNAVISDNIQCSIKGNGGALTSTTELDKENSNYQKLEDNLNNIIDKSKYDITTLTAFDIEEVSGEYQGKINLTFNVGSEHNGKKYIVGHLKNGQDYESFEGIVENGKIEIEVDSLSPFMISVLEEKEDTTPTAPTEQEQTINTDDKELDETPKTGENNITNVICLTAIVLSVAGIVIIKKYIK